MFPQKVFFLRMVPLKVYMKALTYFFHFQKASWSFDGNKVNLVKKSEIIDTSNYIENGEWCLEKLTAIRNIIIYSCCPEPYPYITYYVIIKRRPTFYIFNMILPNFLITMVGYFIFLMPPDTDKVGV